MMIALALACRPSLVIADEPTTALDVVIQAQVLQLLEQLRERLGLALILISHDLGVLAETCDRIAIMYAGRIVETGPVAPSSRLPQHPYTKRLLDSLPVIGGRSGPRRPDPRRPARSGRAARWLPLSAALPLRGRPLPLRPGAARDFARATARRATSRPGASGRLPDGPQPRRRADER